MPEAKKKGGRYGKKIRIKIYRGETRKTRICVNAIIPECRFSGILDELHAVIRLLQENARTRKLQTDDATKWRFRTVSLFECLNCEGLCVEDHLYNKICVYGRPDFPISFHTEAIITDAWDTWKENVDQQFRRNYEINIKTKEIMMENVITKDRTHVPYVYDLKELPFPETCCHNRIRIYVPFVDIEDLAEEAKEVEDKKQNTSGGTNPESTDISCTGNT